MAAMCMLLSLFCLFVLCGIVLLLVVKWVLKYVCCSKKVDLVHKAVHVAN